MYDEQESEPPGIPEDRWHRARRGCGGQGGGNELIFTWGPDDTGALTKLIDEYKAGAGSRLETPGDFRVAVRARPEAYTEEVEEDAQDGKDRDGEDHAGEPG